MGVFAKGANRPGVVGFSGSIVNDPVHLIQGANLSPLAQLLIRFEGTVQH